MKKIRNIIITISLILACVAIAIVLNRHSFALDYSPRYLYQLCEESYDSVAGYSFTDEEVQYLVEYDPYNLWDGYYQNMACLNCSADTDIGAYLSLSAILDIDGETATLTYRSLSGTTISGEVKTTTFTDPLNKHMAGMAYFLENAYNQGNSKDYVTPIQSFKMLWDEDNYYALLSSYCGWSKDYHNDLDYYAYLHNGYQFGKAYMNGDSKYTIENITENDRKYRAGEEIDVASNYQARIFFYASSGGQDRVIMFGKPGTSIKTNKYITSTDSVYVSDRSGLSDSDKVASPVEEVPTGDEVTFTIPLINESDQELVNVTFEDEYDDYAYEYVSCTTDGTWDTNPYQSATSSRSGFKKIEGKLTSIPANTTVTVTVVLKVKNTCVPSSEDELFYNYARANETAWHPDVITVLPCKPMIDKYITNIEIVGEPPEDEDDEIDITTPRLAQTKEEWNGGKDSWRKSHAPKVAYGGVQVTYVIRVYNDGGNTLEGTLSDTYDSFFKNLSPSNVNGKRLSLEPGEEYMETFTVTLDGKVDYEDGLYKNTAIFTPDNGAEVSASDWVRLGNIKPPSINKYITDITNGNHSGNRSTMSEDEKVSSPDDAGDNTTAKIVYYNVDITNPNTFEIEGTFTDEADDGVSISSMTYNGTSISSGSLITIPANTTITVYIVANVATDTAPGIYANMARFVYDTMSVESRDYFEIEGDIQIEMTLHKYISSLSGTYGNKSGGEDERSSMSIEQKDLSPVEVVKGTEVTFKVAISVDKVEYTNYSGWCHGEQCDEHLDLQRLNIVKCKDEWDAGLEYKSISGNHGVSFSGDEIVWSSSDSDYIYEGEVLTAYLTFEVTASDMKLMNLANTAGGGNGIYWEFYEYHCRPYHAEYHSRPCAKHGSHTWCDHTACGFNHNKNTISGYISQMDKDYVRLLDPVVEGKVWEDINKDGLSTAENLGSIDTKYPGLNYTDVTVYLYLSEGNTQITSVKADPVDGSYSFGRVRKGLYKEGSILTQNSSNEYTEIGENNQFKYTDDNTYVNYYIVFEYNGERYEATSPVVNLRDNEDANMETNSNASEKTTDRTEFNESLETIAEDIAYAGTSGSDSSKDLSYDEQGSNLQVSKLIYGGAGTSLSMKSNTRKVYGTDVDKNIASVEYLKHIDFGIFERDHVDLSLEKDVVKAEVTVNGYKAIYNFEKLGSGEYTKTSSNTISKPYTLMVYREDYEFRTANYGSAIETIQNANNPNTSYGRTNDLEVLLTYKITITNESPDNYDAIVREVVDYSSTEMTIVAADVAYNTSSEYNSAGSHAGGANAHYFSGTGLTGTTLGTSEDDNSMSFTVTYRVNHTADGYINIDTASDGIDSGKFNYAEIAAYSIYEPGTDTPAGLVDMDSNPHNTEPTDENSYEDDSFKTSINVITRDDPGTPPGTPPDDPPGTPPSETKQMFRNISGVVWEDVDKTANASTDKQTVGDGTKNGNDIFAENVLVKLFEVVISSDGTEYYLDTGMWYRTGNDGRYYFGDASKGTGSTTNESNDDAYRLHAGKYTVRFIYGDEADYLFSSKLTLGATRPVYDSTGNTVRYSGQDYKSTYYTDPGTMLNEIQSGEIIETNAFKNASGDTSTGFDTNIGGNILSFARDNEVRRLEVNSYSQTMTNPMDNVLKAIADPSNLNLNHADDRKVLAKNTSMYADTKKFDMRIEYIDNYESDKETVTNDDGTYTIDKYYYSVKDVNFGIEERPITKLQLMKDITEVKAETSSGEVILDVFFDVYYTRDDDGIKYNHYAVRNDHKSIGMQNIQVFNRNGLNQGFRYVNVDEDILQGMVVTGVYRLAIVNNSEIDHMNAAFQGVVKQGSVGLTVTDSENTGGAAISDLDVGTRNATNKTIHEKTRNSSDYNYAQDRTYNYSLSTLYDKSQSLKLSTVSGQNYKYTASTTNHTEDSSGLNKGSTDVKTSYSIVNIRKVTGEGDYYTGKYIGNIYYRNNVSFNPGTIVGNSGSTTVTDAVVESKVDRVFDAVDNDVDFDSSINVYSDGSTQGARFEALTPQEISLQGLQSGVICIGSTIVGNDGGKIYADGRGKYYYNPSANHNNLVYTVEDSRVNPTLVKYLKPIDSLTNQYTNISSYTEEVVGTDLNKDNVKTSALTENLFTYSNTAGWDANGNGTYTDNIMSIGNPYNVTVDINQDGTIDSKDYIAAIANGQYNPEWYEATIVDKLYTVDLVERKVLSSNMSDNGFQIDNIAEIAKFTNTVGRKVLVSSSLDRTAYIGNVLPQIPEIYNPTTDPGSPNPPPNGELDTDWAEYITFSPPTGMVGEQLEKYGIEQKVINTALILVPSLVIIVGSVYVIIQFIRRKKFYK